MKLHFLIKALLILSLSMSMAASAEESHEHRHHEAHVHGVAELSFLIDKTSISFELKSPALNLLGFEHEPSTKDEKEKVHDVNNKLSNYENIINIPLLDCKATEFELESPYQDEHSEKAHHDGHADEHDHDHHKEHDEEHGDYYLSYSINCKNIDKLEMIEVKLFDNFTGFENIEAMWINQKNSGSSGLNSEQKIIKFK